MQNMELFKTKTLFFVLKEAGHPKEGDQSEIVEAAYKKAGKEQPEEGFCHAQILSQYFRIDIMFFINEIRNNIFMRSVSRNYWLNEYPQKILEDPKKKDLSLPNYLVDLLNDKQKQYLHSNWHYKYIKQLNARNMQIKL